MSTMTEDTTALLLGENVIGDGLSRGAAGVAPHLYPVTGLPIGELALSTPDDVDAAVSAAHRAFGEWRKVPPPMRRHLLARLADLIVERKPSFDLLNAYELGVPLSMGSTAELTSLWFQYYAGWVDKLDDRVPVLSTASGLGYTRTDPYGVIAVITPFNGALIDIGLKVAAALAAGNTVVIKPSELSPFSAVLFGQLALEAGLPPGVVNVIQGGGDVGDALVRHPLVKKVSFTGGAATAKAILIAAAESLKPVVTELGGKSANIIFPDADLGRALGFSAFFGLAVQAGQNCQRPSRLFLHRSIHDEALAQIVGIAESFQLGDPFEPTTTMGPLISGRALDSCLGAVERTLRDGQGRLACGGSRLDGPLANGNFLRPTVLADVDPAAPLAQQEVFGPVLSVHVFDSEEEVVELANGTEYGLSSYVHTQDLARAHRLAADLESGMVNINGFYNVNPGSPFGGWKASGVGREGGRWGIEEFLQVKNVHVDF